MNSKESVDHLPDTKITVSLWRGSSGTGSFEQYTVPALENQTVLDVVTWLQRHSDPTLSYRYACRVGMCGSCAMMVNQQPRWTCRTHVNKVLIDNHLEIAPLANLPVIKDLVVDMTEFFDKWIDADGVFRPTKSRNDPIETIAPDTPQRQQASAGIECINCAVCYAACGTVTANNRYLGPAALNRAWTLQNDSRDGDKVSRWRAVSGEGGCQNCHSHQSCVQHCPNELNPTAAISGLKRESLLRMLRWKNKP